MELNKNKYSITVALPIYNGACWIEDALHSLSKQTHKSFLIDIVDDGSSDGSAEICRRFANKNANVKFSQNKKNVGGHTNFLNILKRCNTNYIIWACQDDYWDIQFLEKLEDLLNKDKRLVLAQGMIEIIRENGKREFLRPFNSKKPSSFNSFKLAKAILLPGRDGKWAKNNLFLHGLARTKILLKSFELLEGATPGHDRVLLFFLALLGKWECLNSVVFHKRAGVGEALRKNHVGDPVRKAQRAFFVTWKNGYLMARGLYLIRKDFSGSFLPFLSLIFLYVFLWDLHLFRSFITQRILRPLLPAFLFNFVQQMYKKIW